jgi:hypothetical protein
VAVAAGCTNDALDDGDGPDVVLQVEALDNPPVTASLDQTTGICTFTVTDWNYNGKVLAKNSKAEDSSPFNDVSMVGVTVEYNWIDGAVNTPTRTFGLGGIVIPVGGSSQIVFQPIAFDDLDLSISGKTCNLVLTFEGVTVEGTRIRSTVGRQLTVETCA